MTYHPTIDTIAAGLSRDGSSVGEMATKREDGWVSCRGSGTGGGSLPRRQHSKRPGDNSRRRRGVHLPEVSDTNDGLKPGSR
jgi:hypothetical protein